MQRVLVVGRLLGVATTVLVLGSGAHVLGGGHAPSGGALALIGALVLVGSAALARRPLTVRVLLPAAVAGQLAVHVPEERMVFTGDTIFSGCQTWLMGSNVTQWLTALDRIAALDVDRIVPGHGEVVTKQYLARQRANLLEWVEAVADAIAKGWSREETVERVHFTERYPVDIGQGHMMQHIQTLNAGSLWDKLTQARPA